MIKIVALTLVSIVLFSGCASQSGAYSTNNIGNGALVGAASAATASAVLGGNSGDILKSAGVGAAVGAVGAVLTSPQQ